MDALCVLGKKNGPNHPLVPPTHGHVLNQSTRQGNARLGLVGVLNLFFPRSPPLLFTFYVTTHPRKSGRRTRYEEGDVEGMVAVDLKIT
jgi:hypothetical protein